MTNSNHRAQYQYHGHECSAVNHAPIDNLAPKRIQNRVYRQCAKDGFNARLKAELSQELNQELSQELNQEPTNNLSLASNIPLYSHHSTRQSYFNLGWQAVTPAHLIRAKTRAQYQTQKQVDLSKAVK